MKTSKKGISLIVLVITIIVMIILATAIILSLSGSDIRGKAEDAVSATDISSAKEVVSVASSEWELNYETLSEEYDHFGKYATKKVEDAGITNVVVSKDGAINTKYVDKKGDTAIIPEGFSVSSVKSEQTIDDGLVIIDENGNEFVWVPVDDYENRFKRTTTYRPTEDITDPGSDYSEPYKEFSAVKDPTGEYAEEAKMRESVQEYKGFYIARYEAGLPEGKNPTTITIADKPVSKKEATVWNNIPWGKSMTEIGTSGAVYYARQMYKGSKSVASTLCYGVQWDAALQFIATKDADYAASSDVKGNYTDALVTAGYSEDYAANNIYDMVGNAIEFTMESGATGCRILRGSSHKQIKPASNRQLDVPTNFYNNYGFRPALYLK